MIDKRNKGKGFFAAMFTAVAGLFAGSQKTMIRETIPHAERSA